MLSGPSTTLHQRSRRYDWEGPGLLSIKTFTGGQARYRAGSGHFVVHDGNFLILNHGQEYAITIDSEPPVESFCVFFAAGLAEEIRRSHEAPTEVLLDDPRGKSRMHARFVERTYTRSGAIARLLDHLRTGGMAPQGEDEAYRLLIAMLLRLQRDTHRDAETLSAARPATREELYRRLHLARDYAEAYLDTSVTLDDLATVACLSPNHLLRTFADAFSQTPHQYITRRRLERAQRLLETTDLPITDICLTVGFHSLGSFTSLFRRRVGRTPGEY